MNEKQAKQTLIMLINNDLRDIMVVFMSDANSGDETPTQAIQWDNYVDSLAELMVEIKARNI
jgi:hypothetical protein